MMAAFFRCRLATKMLLIMVTSILLLKESSGVDTNNFKSCDESGFCKRQREYKPEVSPYRIRPETLILSEDSAEFEITNTQAKVDFIMTLTGYSNGVVRIHMNEKNPLKARYEVPPGDVVSDQLTKQRLIQISEDGSSFVLLLSQTQTTIRCSNNPQFLLEVFDDETLVLTVNSRGLMKYEHLRVKPSAAEPQTNEEDAEEDPAAPSPPPEENEQKEEEKAEPEEHSMWEEKYKTHQDSKPNGPTSIGIDVSFIGFENVYGIPEHADSFSLRSTGDTDPYRLYNLDVFEYEIDSTMALYGAVPFMIAHSQHRTCGIFWNNPSEMWIDISNSIADQSTLGKIVGFVTQDNKIPQMDTRWIAESGVLDIYYVPGPRPYNVFKQYADLTGVTALPPLFSISYHQCRWNYNDEADVKQVHDNFDLHDIPLDVIWLDIEHTDGKRYFTWDGSKFPTPENMVSDLQSKGRRLVTIVDPHLKRDDNYHVYKGMKDAGFMIQDRHGSEFDGWCWPGSSSYPDFTRADVRKYWAEKFHLDQYKGTTAEGVFTWNDMNEPSVFNGPEITLHKDAHHAGGWEHRDVHNLYGMYVQRATAEGQILRSHGRLRPFVLTRSFYAGSQKYGAVWTGDNMGEWSHLEASVSMILSQSVTGITFTGADVGGFFRNPSEQLITRWYQMGAFSPFFRAHGHLDTRRREPWLLAEENKNIIREAISTRYALLPYWYTLFYIGEVDAIPPVRPFWAEYPSDVSLFKEQNQFLVGDGILVRPVLAEDTFNVEVKFPQRSDDVVEVWYDPIDWSVYHSANKYTVSAPLNKIPHYYKSGSIIPRKDRIRRSSTQMYDDPYTLVISLSPNNQTAAGRLYIDDYNTFNYRSGEFIYRQFTFDETSLKSESLNTPTNGFNTNSWLEKVLIVGLTDFPVKSTITDSRGVTSELSMKTDTGTRLLTLRKPQVNMGDDWTINFQY